MSSEESKWIEPQDIIKNDQASHLDKKIMHLQAINQKFDQSLRDIQA